jgi:CRP-like cAMP-binding protein
MPGIPSFFAVIVRSMPLFSALSNDEVGEIINRATPAYAKAGSDVLVEGELAGEPLYVVTNGCVEVLKGGQLVAELGSGQWFGEMALIEQKPRNATVRAKTDCEFYVFSRSAFLDFVTKYPHMRSTIDATYQARKNN